MDLATGFPGLTPGEPLQYSFGDERAEGAAALSGTIVAPLLHLGVVRAAGADADAFLQGQLSNDVRRLGATRAQLSSYSSPKGRLLAVMGLQREPDGAVALVLHRAVLEPVLKRLRMFVLRSKVTLEDASASTLLLGCAGPDAQRCLADAGLPVPAQPFESLRGADGALSVTRAPGDAPRYAIAGPRDAVLALWPGLAASATPAGTNAWKLLEIEAGVPTIYPQTQDRFVAQWCNLDQLGAISFDKGCYTGQEIIARVHYRGTVKRRMIGVHRSEDALAPGSRIALDTGPAEVVDSARHPGGGVNALVVTGVEGAD